MAIDDNTVYGLTGAQLKELPGKIDAVKGAAKVLTDADFNYPTNNPTELDLWRLPEGIYDVSAVNQQKLMVANGWYGSNTGSVGLVIITDVYDNSILKKNITVFTRESYGNNTVYSTCVSTSGAGVPGDPVNGRLLNGYGVTDNLTTNDHQKVLSAKQGKVLKDLIDAIVVPTKVSDLTNDSGYQTASDVSAAISTAISSVMTFKGTVATVADLPSGAAVGDVYNVTATGDNYVWDGSAWDKLSGTVDLSNYYTKTETDTALAAKADASTTYTKTQVDTALSAKADASTTYTKTEVDTALGAKANSTDVYTKAQVDTALNSKADAPAAGTTYVTDTAMTTALASKADASTTYTKTEVDTALASKAGTSTATTSANGLMSSTDKTKLDGIASGAEANVQSDWSQTNTAADDFIKNKPTIPTVPTTVSSFTNDAGYQTASDVTAAISSMAPIVTLTSTDPGEGQPLPSNQLLGVY